MTREVPAAGATREIDVRGLLTVRLIGVDERDAGAVERQLGLPSHPALEARPAEEAQLSVRYVERLAARDGRLLWVGPPDLCWTEAGVAVARGRGRATRWALIPFERIGGPLEIECERGIGRVPHLVSLLNLSLLARGIVPLHASAFILNGVGSVAAGWSQSGKTEALLAAMGAGATQVSDEWTYLAPDGQAHGLPTPIRLEPWHLRSDFVRERAAAATSRRRLLSLRAADRLAAGTALRRMSLPSTGLVRRGRRLIGSDHVDIPAQTLFGPNSCTAALRLERVYWLVPRTGDDRSVSGVGVESVTATETAARMALAHVHHRLEFLDSYWRFRYAFPRRRSELVDNMEVRERKLLEAALDPLPIYRLEHPPGVSFDELQKAMSGAFG